MESGSLVKDGETFSGKAGGVHAAVNGALKGSLQMRGSAVIQNTDVYLETETQIDLAGILSARPIARITPAVYPDPLDPLTDVWVLAGPTIGGNCSRFDVTPENVPGWSGPRHWRINSAGKLESIIAMHYDVGNSEMKYYSDLQLAFSIALGSPEQYDAVILLANIERDAAAPPLDIALSKYIRLTVPENTSYTIRRAAAASGTQTALDSMFRVNVYAGFELAVPSGAELIIDGGAVWEDGSGSPLGPARGGINVGKASTVIKTNAPLIRVIGGGGGNGTFKMGPGIIIRNNDNTTNGGAILMEGNFEMNGGSITMNRSAGEGGGIYFSTSNFFESILQNGVTVSRYGTTRTILGGSITNNDAGLCGGGIMLSPYGHVRLTMKGGSITGNRAGGPLSLVTFNGRGGGIYIPSNNAVNTAFTMEGGSISGNSAAGFGDNVAIDRKWFPAPVFTLSGSPHIEDIYLDYNVNPAYPEYITVPAAINAAPIHVKLTAPIPQNNSSRRIFAGSGFDPAQFSADAPYVITADGRIRHP
jgi:hypothetical protein